MGVKEIIVLLLNFPFLPGLLPVITCWTVESLTCVCSLGKRVKLFKFEWRSRKRRFLLCLMTIFNIHTQNILAPPWSTSVVNPNVGRILRKGQKFRWGVKIQNNSRMSSHLGLFLPEQQVCTLCYRINCKQLFLIVPISIPGPPDCRGKMNSIQL